MTTPFQATKNLKSFALVMLAIIMANLVISERLVDYVNPRAIWEFMLAIVLLLLIAQGTQVSARHFGQSEVSDARSTNIVRILIVIIPILLPEIYRPPNGIAPFSQVLTQPTPLTSYSASSDFSGFNVLDWAGWIAEHSDPHSLDGQHVSIDGVVYPYPTPSGDLVLLTRSRVSSSTADSQGVGLIVQIKNNSDFPTGTWVHVKGLFEASQELSIPILIASEVHVVQAPEHPYLYP